MGENNKYHVSFIGSGNVAFHLAKNMYKVGVLIDEIWSPNRENREYLAKIVMAKAAKSLADITPSSDFYIIAVPDDKVNEVVDNLPRLMGIVAHTSGITPIEVISSRFNNSGVFYPLQTFSKQRDVNITTTPFCIEGNTNAASEKLSDLAGKLSRNIYPINSNERKELHLAAVFVSNFVNHLYHTANTLIKENGLSFDLLLPLIEEVAAKTKTLSLDEAQTGPARRNDENTLKTHSAMLNSHPDIKTLYDLITSQIIKQFHEEL